jgi:hypothetical protein
MQSGNSALHRQCCKTLVNLSRTKTLVNLSRTKNVVHESAIKIKTFLLRFSRLAAGKELGGSWAWWSPHVQAVRADRRRRDPDQEPHRIRPLATLAGLCMRAVLGHLQDPARPCLPQESPPPKEQEHAEARCGPAAFLPARGSTSPAYRPWGTTVSACGGQTWGTKGWRSGFWGCSIPGRCWGTSAATSRSKISRETFLQTVLVGEHAD